MQQHSQQQLWWMCFLSNGVCVCADNCNECRNNGTTQQQSKRSNVTRRHSNCCNRRRCVSSSSFSMGYGTMGRMSSAILAAAAAAAASISMRTHVTASSSSSSSSSTKPLVRGYEYQSSGSRSGDSHLLRNHPLRTINDTPLSSTSSSATNLGNLQHQTKNINQPQPTRNLLVVDNVDDLNDRHYEEEDDALSSLSLFSKKQHEEFLQWCYEIWGIDSSLVEIDVFEYNDYILAMEERIDIFWEDGLAGILDGEEEGQAHGLVTGEYSFYDHLEEEEEDRLISITDYPSVPVRGLKAAREIDIGEVILSIPHRALWTLSNIIDKDPVLSKIMGKQIREQFGWDSPIDEIPLLAVALLYHIQQVHSDSAKESLHGPYLQVLLQQTKIVDTIPHLWSSHKLRRSASPQVRKVAKGIQRDVIELYETIVLVLVEEHPDVFGEAWEEFRTTDDDINLTKEQRGTHRHYHESHERIMVDENGFEWMFSLERFHWAFALINSRHWHLPVPENVSENPPPNHYDERGNDDDGDFPTETEAEDNVSFNGQPPASMPTEEWMQHQRDMQIKKGGRESTQEYPVPPEYESESLPAGNSFLAPVADLLNFGPPCTRGMYNRTTDSFEIIATCPFHQGQEITFWYTDACDDVFMANYGFTMPMLVPKCPNAQEEARAKIRHLSRDLNVVYQQLDLMDQQMDELLTVMHECHCENQTDYLKIRRRKGPGGPPKAPSPIQGNNHVYLNSEDYDDNKAEKGDSVVNDRINRVQQQNRNNGNISNQRGNDSKSNNNDARHAIRGQEEGRRSSSKERTTTTTFPSSSSSSSSSKGRRRQRPNSASRKLEF
jgi:hypothetical protein